MRHNIEMLLNKRSWHIICIFFISIVAVKVLLSLYFYAPSIFPDELEYDSIAHNIIYGNLFPMLGESLPPGYPLLLSFAYHISNNKNIIYHVMLVISAFISSTIIFPAYLLLEKYCTKGISILGSIVIATLSFINYYSFTLMTEVLFVPLFLFSIWFILKSYETDDKKWAFLASASTVYLYMTRSNGLAMLIAFFLTFIYYIVINVKSEKLAVLISKKSFLMGTFIIFLSAWLIYSTYFVNISEPFNRELTNIYYYGSSYNYNVVSNHSFDAILNLGNFITLIRYSSNMIAYLSLSSFLFLILIIFYFILLVANKKVIKNNPLSIAIFYVSIASVLLILATISFLFDGGYKNWILGRYIEPTIPIIMVFGIICISNIDRKIMDIKHIYYFTIICIPLILLMLLVFTWDNSIIYEFNDLQDHASIYAYTIFYGQGSTPLTQTPSMYIVPSLLMLLYFSLIVVLLSLSLKNNKYIGLLLAFILISSIVFSINIYREEVAQSNNGTDNAIGRYLNDNTGDETIFLIDNSTGYSNTGIEQYNYGFWNNGDAAYYNTSKTSTIARSVNKTSFLISIKPLPYNITANDGAFKLYKI